MEKYTIRTTHNSGIIAKLHFIAINHNDAMSRFENVSQSYRKAGYGSISKIELKQGSKVWATIKVA